MCLYKIYKNPFKFEDFFKANFLKEKIIEVSSKWEDGEYIKGNLESGDLRIEVDHIRNLIGCSGSSAQEDTTPGKWIVSVVDSFCAYLWASSYYALVAFDYLILSQSGYIVGANTVLPSGDMLYGAACLKKFANEGILSGQANGRWAYYPYTTALLPNPFICESNREYYITKVNGIYAFALAFVLCHEYKHYYYNEQKDDADDFVNIEREFSADSEALSTYKNLDEKEKMTYAAGIATVMYVISKMDRWADYQKIETDSSHPSAFDRLIRALDGLSLSDDDILFEYAGFLFENEKNGDFLHPVNSSKSYQCKLDYFQNMLKL